MGIQTDSCPIPEICPMQWSRLARGVWLSAPRFCLALRTRRPTAPGLTRCLGQNGSREMVSRSQRYHRQCQQRGSLGVHSMGSAMLGAWYLLLRRLLRERIPPQAIYLKCRQCARRDGPEGTESDPSPQRSASRNRTVQKSCQRC